MTLFPIATILFAVIPLYFGVTGMAFGAAQLMVGEPITTAMDNQFRYLSGVYIGIGLMLFYSAGDILGRALVFRLAIVAVFIGGLARVVSYFNVGEPEPWQMGGMVLELISPIFILWQTKVLKTAS
ncbi:MAG: DUF4345 domain-containing protein [Parasphingorhabdus sp.]|uniref:DUF4345 domain-containing protein n=1 Tax=Parasphingorhabdus sp. TaxID=2709688 RepID=UPI003001C914